MHINKTLWKILISQPNSSNLTVKLGKTVFFGTIMQV